MSPKTCVGLAWVVVGGVVGQLIWMSVAAQDGAFYRGDCNMSLEADGTAVDITDVAAVISYLFGAEGGGPAYVPPCMDACDANDDGVLDMSDPMYLLQYLFRFGPFPLAPGPGLRRLPEGGVDLTPVGEDPTPDTFGCESGA